MSLVLPCVSPTVYESIDALEKAQQKGNNDGRETGSSSEGEKLSEDRGKLAPVASRILMKVLWGWGTACPVRSASSSLSSGAEGY